MRPIHSEVGVVVHPAPEERAGDLQRHATAQADSLVNIATKSEEVCKSKHWNLFDTRFGRRATRTSKGRSKVALVASPPFLNRQVAMPRTLGL